MPRTGRISASGSVQPDRTLTNPRGARKIVRPRSELTGCLRALLMLGSSVLVSRADGIDEISTTDPQRCRKAGTRRPTFNPSVGCGVAKA